MICRKGNKEHFVLKSITLIDPIAGQSKITEYNKKRAMNIENLVETSWLTLYPWPTEITYEQGSELIGHEFRKPLIER